MKCQCFDCWRDSMKFDQKIHQLYQQAYARAMRSRETAKKHAEPMNPISLNVLIKNHAVSYRQHLGFLDVPTNLIVGVEEASEKTQNYSQDFLPAVIPNSPFADQWKMICEAYLHDGTAQSELHCVEYMGKFYISDGITWVSVAKSMDIPIIRSRVTRILPIRTNTKSVQLYYDFLTQFRKTKLYQIQFTQPAYFEKFQTALGFRVDHVWTDLDRSDFLPVWNKIENAFYKSYDNTLRITAADAMVVLLEKYSYDQIVYMDSWVLARLFQALWKELCALSFPDTMATKNTQMIFGVMPHAETRQTA